MDQQFRLKWNNHCNTLLQVFGNLLKTETLVDCTIGADGQYLKAHKVVVSACSPYFQSLFTEHFDKHPIIILKDIKFAELQSMIDYMYEGEVNISQDQLPSFLKAAASIQLKGLTQNVKSEAPPPPQSPPSSKPPLPQLNSARGGMLSNGSLTPSSMLNVELEEGQQRKKRKLGATGTEPSSASSSPSLVPDLVTPSVILDVPGENTGAGATVGQNGQGGGGGQSGDGGLMKKEPSEYSGRSEDEEEDGMSHDGWDLSNDGLHDSNSTMSAGDRTGQGPGGLHHNTPAGGMRPAGGPGGLSAAGGPDMSNVDENNQASSNKYLKFSGSSNFCQYCKDLLPSDSIELLEHCRLCVYTGFRDKFHKYMCVACTYYSHKRDNMRVHLRIHTGEKPFICTLCDFKTAQKQHLKTHMVMIHNTELSSDIISNMTKC